jgi:ribosomal protein L11 methyltransferase
LGLRVESLKYPALDVTGVDGDLLLALVDDFSPTAAEDHGSRITLYFTDSGRRDLASLAILGAQPDAAVCPRDVDDDDWARRSQENLTPIVVGRVTVTPPSSTSSLHLPASGSWPSSDGDSRGPTPGEPVVIVIAPSMGFGTGHHATTRLCLAALQTLQLAGARALDVGTGSGVLAIAARLLGAREARGLDNDADAIQAARENLARNPTVSAVVFDVGDFRETAFAPADVVTANLTGAMLARGASRLLNAVAPHGSLIVSGLLQGERDEIIEAFASARPVWEAEEDGWIAVRFQAPPFAPPPSP